jgi:LuxR family maltose regulon positive regulatory protein
LATSILGDASWLNGDLETAREAYTEAVRIGRTADNIHLAIIANSHIAETLIEQGQLHAAARTYTESLKMATGQNEHTSPVAARVHAGLGQVSYEWNHLEAATRHVHQCIELSRQWESIEFQAVGFVMLARLEQAQCHPEKAKDAMRAADDLEGSYQLAQRQSIWVRSALARLWITQGNPERTASFLQKDGIEIDGEISYLREPEYLVLLRLLLAQGDYDAALTLGQRLLQKAETANRMERVIEVLVLQALIFQGNANMDQALAVLGRALSLAQPEGFVRTFLDEGIPMAKLLHQARTHRIQAGYATELLDAMGEAVSATQAPAQILIEPLTVRELEVMRLIEAGCSNQEVAAKLVVSIPTVKRHISNIYAKLGVKSRTQAIALGKELRLLK